MKKIVLIIMFLMAGFTCDPQAMAASAALSDYPETIAVLRLLYADHMQAYREDVEFAGKAHSEKKAGCKALFNALAASDLIRANNLRYLLTELGIPTADIPPSEFGISRSRLNLKAVKNIRLAPVDRKYTFLLKRMMDEKHAVAIQWVTHAWKAEVRQRELVSHVLSTMEAFFGIGARVPELFYVCQQCGSTVLEVPELTCSVCQGPTSQYLPGDLKAQFYRYIDGNGRLSAKEKAYAKRTYDYISAQELNEDTVRIPTEIYFSALYKKWGLGPEREFCPSEKAYLLRLDEIAQMWNDYNSIELKRLDQFDREFLQEMHSTYGPGPIDLLAEQKRQTNKLSENVERILRRVEVVSGNTRFDDRDLIFLRIHLHDHSKALAQNAK